MGRVLIACLCSIKVNLGIMKHSFKLNLKLIQGLCLLNAVGGGDLIEGNLIFNMVRETDDHGPINRQLL